MEYYLHMAKQEVYLGRDGWLVRAARCDIRTRHSSDYEVNVKLICKQSAPSKMFGLFIGIINHYSGCVAVLVGVDGGRVYDCDVLVSMLGGTYICQQLTL